MTGWNTVRKPKEGIRLYFGPLDDTTVTVQSNGKITLYNVVAFLDRTTCERIKKSIIEAERKYWEKKRKRSQ